MTRREWLDAGEQRAWIGLLASASLLDAALDARLQADSGLSHTQYSILSRLSEAPGRTMHMNALARMTSTSQSRLSHAVTRLADLGWVERSRCPATARAVHATLTEAGWDIVAAAAPGHAAEVRRLVFDHLSREQVDQLSAITRAVLEALAGEGYAIPPAPQAS